ncbi:hypothetical protein E2C01_051355 [Portunus trituberculatus]|uniref:Uncharacterized protein n=1 Tax=Portunus trituberculatus TaxID=210409 RepID=A0A5B7GIZ4_PORTR|nr:hypothetical protein [Portunus trituberculatus]
MLWWEQRAILSHCRPAMTKPALRRSAWRGSNRVSSNDFSSCFPGQPRNSVSWDTTVPGSRITSHTNGEECMHGRRRNGEQEGRTDWKKPARRRYEAAHHCLPITSLGKAASQDPPATSHQRQSCWLLAPPQPPPPPPHRNTSPSTPSLSSSTTAFAASIPIQCALPPSFALPRSLLSTHATVISAPVLSSRHPSFSTCFTLLDLLVLGQRSSPVPSPIASHITHMRPPPNGPITFLFHRPSTGLPAFHHTPPKMHYPPLLQAPPPPRPLSLPPSLL